MIRFTTRMSFLFALAAIGCGGRGNVDLLESRLREQEDRLSALQSQLEQTRSELTIARKESRTLRTQLASQGKPALLPERAEVLFRAAGMQFNQLFTGGLDRDGRTGDELLIATLVPHDAQGEMVKLPGRIQLEAFDLAQSGEKRKIGHWSFNTDQAATHWHRGYLASGYMFRLPWQQVPEHSRLVLHAKLTTPDGRQFDATREVEIAPPIKSVAQGHSPARLPTLDDPTGSRFAETPSRVPAPPIRQTGGRSPAPLPLLLSPSDGGDAKQAPAFPDSAADNRPENPFSDERSVESAESSGTKPSPTLTMKPDNTPRLLPLPNLPIELPPAKSGDAKPSANRSRLQSGPPANVSPKKQDGSPRLFRRSAPPLRTSDNFTERTQPAYH